MMRGVDPKLDGFLFEMTVAGGDTAGCFSLDGMWVTFVMAAVRG